MEILSLELLAPDLNKLADFYGEKIGLPAIVRKADEIGFQAGESELFFKQAEAGWKGFYHIAFNIEEEKLFEAKHWLAERITLIPNRDWQDIFHFEAWNADALYSKDPAGNIVEFIARHDLKETSGKAVSNAFILSISEVGTVVDDVPTFVKQLTSKLGTGLYHNTFNESFAAIGDESGLLLVARKGREWYPNNGKFAQFAPFKLEINLDSSPHRIEAGYKKPLWGTPKDVIKID
jgi:catechol-2,3-dioxygenase